MKAREVKRAKLVARYAEKRAALKKIIARALWQPMRQPASCRASPRTPTPSVCTTVARSRVVRRVTCASSASPVSSSVRWHQAV